MGQYFFARRDNILLANVSSYYTYNTIFCSEKKNEDAIVWASYQGYLQKAVVFPSFLLKQKF